MLTKTSKSAVIRDILEKNPEFKAKEIVAELAKRKVKASEALVNKLLYTRIGKKTKKRKVKVTRVSLTMDDLFAASNLVRVVGSPERGHDALEALEKLRN